MPASELTSNERLQKIEISDNIDSLESLNNWIQSVHDHEDEEESMLFVLKV